MIPTASWILLAAVSISGPATGSRTESGNDIRLTHCQIFFIRDVQVPAEETGPLVRVAAKEGIFVRQNQILAKIDDREAQLQRLSAELERDAAVARASDDIEVEYAIASHEVAEAELNRSLEINNRSPNSVTVAEISRQRLSKHRAQLQIDRSRLDLQVAKMTADVEQAEVQAAEQRIMKRQIVAPFDGVVLEVFRQSAEWINAGEPVVRLVQLDRLRVDAFMDASAFNAEDVIGKPVTVEAQRARGHIVQFHGTIVWVNPVVQPGHKYRVRAEVENRMDGESWLLGPGMPASMVIHWR